MKDELDKLLDDYAVHTTVDRILVEKIVARAEQDKKHRSANENVLFSPAYRVATAAVIATIGFCLGNIVSERPNYSIEMKPQSVSSQEYYLDHIILGPRALNNIEL